jgi:hypothetical protein
MANPARALTRHAPTPRNGLDYYARAVALWPPLEYPKLGRVRRDPNLMAALISRRTTLPVEAILALLGVAAPSDEIRSRDP